MDEDGEPFSVISAGFKPQFTRTLVSALMNYAMRLTQEVMES